MGGELEQGGVYDCPCLSGIQLKQNTGCLQMKAKVLHQNKSLDFF